MKEGGPESKLDGTPGAVEMRSNPLSREDAKTLTPQKARTPILSKAGKKKQKLRKLRKAQDSLSFCTNVGWDGALVLLAMYAISIAQLCVAFITTGSFRTFHRWPVFIFFFFHIAYFLLPTYLLCRWRKMSAKYHLAYGKHTVEKRRGGNMCTSLIVAYKSMSVHKPRFLWKFYSHEIIGYIVQLVNLRTILLCAVPAWIGSIISFLMAFEAAKSAYILGQKFTSTVRDRMVEMDATLDLVDAVVPLIAMYSFEILIPLTDLLQLVAWTSFTMLSKFRSLFKEVLRKRTSDEIRQQRSGINLRESQTRTDFEIMVTTQSEAIPTPCRRALRVSFILYSMWAAFLGVWLLVADSIAREDCRSWDRGEYVWQHCTVKSPLCVDVFAPRCDCAVVTINKHNMTALPDVLTSMEALRKITVKQGPLRSLPDSFGSMASQLAIVVFDFNELAALPKSFGSIGSLHTVFMASNRIEHIPRGFWKLPELYGVDLATNRIGSAFEDADVELPNLHFLFLPNNSISRFPQTWKDGSTGSPSLVILDMSGNHLRSLPSSIGRLHYFKELYLARNYLNASSFPPEMAHLRLLEVLDVRNNSLISYPLWASTVRNLYVSGNPFCDTRAAVKECAPQCSDYCVDYYFFNHGCDFGCNVPSCEFDNGQCLQN